MQRELHTRATTAELFLALDRSVRVVPLAELLKSQGSIPFALNVALALGGALAERVATIHASGRIVGAFDAARVQVALDGRVSLTRTGGAPLAPEVKRGADASIESDVFSVASLTYRMLTGRQPTSDAAPPSRFNLKLDAEIDSVMLASLNPDPSQRPASVLALQGALEGLAEELQLDDGADDIAELMSVLLEEPTDPGIVVPVEGARPQIVHLLEAAVEARVAEAAPRDVVAQTVPFAAQTVPFAAQAVPFAAQAVPFAAEAVPFAAAELIQEIAARAEEAPTQRIVELPPSALDRITKAWWSSPGVESAAHTLDEDIAGSSDIVTSDDDATGEHAMPTSQLWVASLALAAAAVLSTVISYRATMPDPYEEPEETPYVLRPPPKNEAKQGFLLEVLQPGQRGQHTSGISAAVPDVVVPVHAKKKHHAHR